MKKAWSSFVTGEDDVHPVDRDQYILAIQLGWKLSYAVIMLEFLSGSSMRIS
jgi:hypothetical protein